jgi:lysyl-tRNA synthetase class 2
MESERQRLDRIGDHLRLRAAVSTTIRAFMAKRDYLEISTPCVVPSPGLDLHLDAFEVGGGGYLITSPEYQMKRLLAGGLERIYQLVPCFRRGERGRHHNPEFTMLEWYRTDSGYRAMMAETEALVRAVFRAHGASHWDAEFEQLTVCEAYQRFADTAPAETLRLSSEDEEQFFRLLIDRVEPGIAALGRPAWLYDYPASQASLARVKPDEPALCERFELYAGGLELCNGFGELTDPVEQRTRLQADQDTRRKQGKPVYPIDERFLSALEQGMPPAAGNALGVDRLVMLCAGVDDISEVQAFPSDWV